MSAAWDCGTPRSQGNAFSAAFVQPIAPKPASPVRGYTRPGYVAPREVVQCDAVDKRMALNSAGKFVSVCMDVPSTSIAPKSDRWGTYE